MNKIYLLTGGAGFLGSNICRQLIGRGDNVRTLVLPNDKAARYVPEKAEICYGDLCDSDSLGKFFTVPEDTETIVIHCASIVTVNPDFSQKVIDVNVGGTKNIIEKCIAHKECRKLVYVSITGAIPELPKGQKISEVDYFSPSDVVGCYSESKALATQAVLDAVKNYGLNACIVHPSGIDGTFNLCDVRDLAFGCVAAADRGKKGECYILGNEEVSFKDFCRMLHEESGCRKVKFFLPLGFAGVLAKIMEKLAEIKGGKPIMTSFSVYNLARNNVFDSTKAKKELGYRTRPYAETIRDEVAWLKNVGKISI